MKKSKKLIMIFSLIGLTACGVSHKKTDSTEVFARTPETDSLYALLKRIPEKGFMFGHQDATVYGIGWEGDSSRSDVKSVCGDYPAVCGWEIGRIETGSVASLDKVAFDKIRQEIIRNYLRGGVNTLSWHIDNPVTGGDSWDISAKDSVVSSILPNGANHSKFLHWLDILADYCNSLVTPCGTRVPVIIRPWHEHTGSWFWWGKAYCTPEQYKKLWVMTYDYLRSKGVNNLLYAYSPGGGCTMEEYMERYPGDEYVDLLGFDYYQMNGAEGSQSYKEAMHTTLKLLTGLGVLHDKPVAVTETGLEALPVKDWWTRVLYPVLSEYPISYVLVWRNAREKENHYYAPYPGQVSAQDFVEFYNLPKTLFLSDNAIWNNFQ